MNNVQASHPAPVPNTLNFLRGAGEMPGRVRSFDWAATPLGPPESWPAPLRSAVGICLQSGFPSAIYWGEDLRLIYNDAWVPIPAERHPGALGQPARELWADIWSIIQPQFEQVRTTGQGFVAYDQMLPLVRGGLVQETYWNYSFTPILDEEGAVVGILNQGHDITARVMAERRQGFALKLSDALRDLSSPLDIIRTAQAMLGEVLGADRVGYGEVEETERYFTTTDNWVRGAMPPRHGVHDLAGFGEAVHAGLRRGEPLIIEDVATDIRTSSPEALAAFAAIDTAAAVTASLVKGGRMVAALYVHAREPRGWSEADIGIVADVAERTWAAVERARAQAQAGASEHRLRQVLDGMNEGFALLGPDFEILDLNAEAMRLDPRPREDLIGRTHWDAYPGTQDSVLGEQYRQAMRDRVSVTLEHCYQWEESRSAWLEMRAFPVEAGLAVFFRDITDRKRAEERVRKSEAELRAVYDAVPVGLITAEAPGGRIIGGNAEVERIFGHPVLPSPDIDSYRDWIGFHDDGRPVASDEYPLSRALRGEAERPELEVLYRRGDGRDAWLRLLASPIRDEEGAISGAVVAALDIDNEKRAIAALQTLNEHLETQVEARTAERDRIWRLSTDLMLVADFQGRIEAVNPAWANLLGWKSEALIGTSFMALVHPDDADATRREMAALEQGVTTFRFTNRYRCADGHYRCISWAAVPGDNFINAVGRDITAERQAAQELEEVQEALRQSQKLEAMGQLTGGVAHDFNNLLSPIIGGLDLLQRRGVGDERAQRTIAAALTSAERAKTLVQRLLAFARRQPLQPTAVDLGAIVESMQDLLASTLGPRVRLSLDVQPDLPAACADANQTEMALLNLVVNARDAMPDGGDLGISVDLCTAEGDKALAPGRYVRISVRDTGKGMDEEVAARCIEPFYSTKDVGQGTGLGLSMVHGLTAQLGGALRIHSRLGVGTTIELWFPETQATVASAIESGAPQMPLSPGVALVVDDEDLVRSSTAGMLEDLGYSVIEAASGEEALRILRMRHVDVLVTDHLMPRMTGTNLAYQVRSAHPNVRLLIVSGYADVDGIAPDLPRLTKPFRLGDLAQALSTPEAAAGAE